MTTTGDVVFVTAVVLSLWIVARMILGSLARWWEASDGNERDRSDER